MTSTSQSQHRCVFVGNIPYDATEEQLIQICEEVGPVVSFRLVIDRETGKPKGYGFCEYKDEETALSARRNLQGYEINGRQLRVDFAENDKNSDRNREQGRGGPGTISSADPQKQFGGPAALRDPSLHQPVGDSAAMAAATVMARALGAGQTASTSDQVGLQSQSLLGTDPLTRHLAKMSRSQLTEIMAEVKAMATQNKEQARKLLLAFPNLPKALFQAQILLGVVSPQMLQMPNIQQTSAQPVQQLLHGGQTVPGLPPLPQNKLNNGVLPYAQDNHLSTGISNPQFPLQSQVQRPQLVQNQATQQGQPFAQAGGSSLPSARPLPISGFSVRPQTHIPNPTLLNHQLQTGQSLHTNLASNGHLMAPNASTRKMVSDSSDQISRVPKMVKLNDGRANPSLMANLATPPSAPSATADLSARQTPIAEGTLNSGRQVTQMQLPSDVDSALLQQVLNLTPEQLNSLPPDQQQQVIQLQQMLRQAT